MVDVMDVVSFRNRAIIFFPYIDVQTNAARATIWANFLAEPIPFLVFIKPFDYACMTQAAAEVFEVELEDGTKFKATANHKVLTEAGWKEVRELTSSDEILQFSCER